MFTYVKEIAKKLQKNYSSVYRVVLSLAMLCLLCGCGFNVGRSGNVITGKMAPYLPCGRFTAYFDGREYWLEEGNLCSNEGRLIEETIGNGYFAVDENNYYFCVLQDGGNDGGCISVVNKETLELVQKFGRVNSAFFVDDGFVFCRDLPLEEGENFFPGISVYSFEESQQAFVPITEDSSDTEAIMGSDFVPVKTSFLEYSAVSKTHGVDVLSLYSRYLNCYIDESVYSVPEEALRGSTFPLVNLGTGLEGPVIRVESHARQSNWARIGVVSQDSIYLIVYWYQATGPLDFTEISVSNQNKVAVYRADVSKGEYAETFSTADNGRVVYIEKNHLYFLSKDAVRRMSIEEKESEIVARGDYSGNIYTEVCGSHLYVYELFNQSPGEVLKELNYKLLLRLPLGHKGTEVLSCGRDKGMASRADQRAANCTALKFR